MTFFLQDQGLEDGAQGRVSPISEVPTFLQSAGAQKRAMDLETNANNTAQRREQMTRDEIAADVMLQGLVPLEDFISDYEQNGPGFDHIRKPPETIEDAFNEFGAELTTFVLDQARARASDNPDAFADLDISDEAIEKRTNDWLRSSYQDAQDIISMTPEEYTGEALLGGVGSAGLDARQAPALVLGGAAGGSLLRLAGREAMINAGLEGALMPSQFEMSERLDIADPNVAQQIAFAAAFGAAFGGGVAAVGRGVDAYRTRQSAPQNLGFEGMGDADVELFLNEVEDALLRGDDPPEAAATPVIPERIPSEEGPVPPRAPDEVYTGPEPVDTIEEALSAEVSEAGAGVIRRPLSDYLRNPQNTSALDNGQSQTMQVHPEGRAADALRAMGITSRTRPGLFSRNGRKDFDNLVASEMEDIFPGIRDAVGDDGRYLNQDGFLSFLADELNGEPVRLRANERLNAAEAQLAEYQAQREILTRRVDAIEDGLDIAVTQARMSEIKSHIDNGIRAAGLDGFITPRQRGDMASMMAERGGSVDDLLDAMDDADLAFAEANIGEPDGRPFAPRTSSDLDTIPDDGTNAGELGAGQQGADGPVPQRNAEEGSAGRGGSDQRAGETDAGSVTGREAFSDPGAATEMQRNIASDITDQIERDGDFDVDINVDGVQLSKASDVMRYLDEGEAFSARINLCGLGPA